MNPSQRRYVILKKLCRRRYDTVQNLATELNVSPRTIERDIDILSATEPVYTLCGRYNGGVYVVDDYSMDRMYMNDTEIHVLQKLYTIVNNSTDLLTYTELKVLESIIAQYTKPTGTKQTYEGI